MINRIKLKSYNFSAFFSIFVLLVYNRTFMTTLIVSEISVQSKLLSVLLVYSALYFLHSIFLSKKTYKFFLCFFCISNCIAMYFMDTYHTLINKDVLINLLETNKNEAINFINLRFIIYLLFFCVFTLIFFSKVINVSFSTYNKEIKYKLYSLILFLSTIFLILLCKNSFYEIRQNKFLGDYIVPINYIRNTYRVTKAKINEKLSKGKFIRISDNFIKLENHFSNEKNLLIIVVGESVRADNWGFNGYERNTSEFLDKYKDNIINFSNVESCGSSTFVSVPCIFSHMNKVDFSVNKAKNTENLLDILSSFNFNVFWLSNNGDCKGVCNRINFESISGSDFDDKLFDRAKTIIKRDNNNENVVLVLHQRGSHGPLYYKQYPDSFEKYKPTCRSDIKDCPIQYVVNSYDNSILYTSYLLSELIHFLEKQKNYDNILLLYVSDHGESFGEKNMFMHAGPYILTKNEQWMVPMFMWIKGYSINKSCVAKISDKEISHDNIFHSILGLFNIRGDYYNNKLDLFSGCQININN